MVTFSAPDSVDTAVFKILNGILILSGHGYQKFSNSGRFRAKWRRPERKALSGVWPPHKQKVLWFNLRGKRAQKEIQKVAKT